MINAITEGISAALNGEFGDGYRIYANDIRQGLEEPCFFVTCVSPASRRFRGDRCRREYLFCIQYFPRSRTAQREECGDVTDRLFLCMRYITADGDRIMGTGMRAEYADGVLSFFVSYNLFVRERPEAVPFMEKLREKVLTEGGRDG